MKNIDYYNKIKEKLIKNEELSLLESIKDPILLENKNNSNNISEYELKELILDNLDDFLKQLGEGYSYISSEYK